MTSAMAQALYDVGGHSIADICQALSVSRATLYWALKPRMPQPPHHT